MVLCSGMKAKDTITAEMAFMFGERNDGESTIDYPLEGSKAIVEALLRGIQKFGGQVLLRTPVEEIVVEGTPLAAACILIFTFWVDRCMLPVTRIKFHLHYSAIQFSGTVQNQANVNSHV